METTTLLPWICCLCAKKNKNGKKKYLFFLSPFREFMHNVREFLATTWHNGKELNLEEIETSHTPGGVGEGRVQGRGKRRVSR